MNTTYYLFSLILCVIWNHSLVKASILRDVKTNTFQKDQYYDVFEYVWDITPTYKVGIFDYTVSSDHAVCSLLMNSTDFSNWENKYYSQWLNNKDFNFSFLNNDLRSFMCMNPLHICTQRNINCPYDKLYLVILKAPPYDETEYTLKDNIGQEYIKNSAKIIYDPLNPPKTSDTSTTSTTIIPSTIISTADNIIPTSSAVSSSSQTGNHQPDKNHYNGINNNGANIDNNNNHSDIPLASPSKDDNKGLVWLSIIFGTLFVLLIAALLYTSKNKRRNVNENSQNDETENQYRNEAGDNIKGISTKIPYNPLHSVKRVAYDYKSDNETIEKNNILEITKRFNDGWANAINPKDGKECLVPLIILEGDLSEDLSNVPFEEKSTKNILATPKSLYENGYISQKDYEEMKRNDEWMKKVKLMKYGKSESGQDIVDKEQFKFVSHPIQETVEENPNQQPLGNRKSMVATVVNSNTDLLNADHVLEVCEEEDEEEEE